MSRSVAHLLLGVATSTLFIVSAYEGLKTLLFPRLTLWESHLVTVAFFTLAVPVVACSALVASRRGRRMIVAFLPLRASHARAAQRDHPPHPRSFIERRVALTSLVTLIAMSAFEGVKQLIHPDITIWQSHLVTIAFATLISMIAAYSAFQRYERMTCQLADSLNEIRRAQHALRESEERYRSLVLNAGEGICVVDANGHFQLANPACESVFGVPPGTLIGRTFDEFVESSVANNGEPTTENPRGVAEVKIVRPDGERRVLLVTSVPQCGGSMRICFDVTEHKQSTDALIRAQRLAALGTLAAGVAHEFNNIHFAILGSLEVALIDATMSPRSRTRLTAARDAVDRAAGITRGLLAFAQVGVAKKSLTSVNDAVVQTIGILRDELQSEGIDIATSLGDLPALPLDGAQISQVVMNLVINARHAMMASATKRLDIATGTQGTRAFIRVRDTGCGISEADMPRLFHPFFTTKGDHAQGGSPLSRVKGLGIGLSVCETIVHAHGGEIVVESTVGAGSAFTVWLPLDYRIGAEPKAGHADSAEESSPERRTGHILVLDDGEVVRDVLTDMLCDAGHSVKATDDGAEALRLLERETFDIVLVDLQMPKMSGVEFLERLRLLNTPRRPFVFVMTGKTVEENLDTYASLGVAETLLKPFSRSALVERIQMALRDMTPRTAAAHPATSAGG